MSVSDLLTELGFKPFNRGWFYLCDCIALLTSDPTAKLTAVYYTVGKRYGVDARAVERLCRHTILATLLRSRHGVFETVLGQPFDSSNGYTVGRFFGLCVAAIYRRNIGGK